MWTALADLARTVFGDGGVEVAVAVQVRVFLNKLR